MPPANFDVVCHAICHDICHAICVDDNDDNNDALAVVVVVGKADARRRESPVHVIRRHATS